MVKKALPAPIDRPLSRAYLRKFTGWSTAFPPGVSDPGSLRTMENLLINREGSVRVRPGLRQLMWLVDPQRQMVGSFEPFYLNDGRKAYLFAVRELEGGGIVTFRVGVPDPVTNEWAVTSLSAAPASFSLAGWAGAPQFSSACTYVRYVQIDNKILALSNSGESFITFHVGATKKVSKIQSLDMPWYDPPDTDASTRQLSPGLVSGNWINGITPGPPAYRPPSDQTLISSDPAKNIYNLGLFITYSNEIGESAPSNIYTLRTQRPLGNWKFEGTDPTNGDIAALPSGTLVQDGRKAADQIIVSLDAAANPAIFNDMLAKGATQVNLYVFAWSNQAPVPVEGVLMATKALTPGMTAANDGWISLNPGSQMMDRSLPLPTKETRTNTSAPAKAAQGLVAADRLVLVNDPSAAAVIRWTTNAQGDYLNFASSRGGGYKTLTSGNMQVPATVKLWQNPQSADTLTVLCMGTDGHSSSYYMAPASVSSQSDNTQIMGFEETTATPGTVSPFGCEVANNALYHPLDDQLMKSTASNYNINHKSMTDDIAPQWQALANKKKIVSCFFDQRLYFLVHNPDGVALPAGCNGNEVWVLDLASEGGSWSRWLTPGVSLKKVDVGGRLLLGLVHPSGMYAFDEQQGFDDYVEGATSGTRSIPWELETNTQGANRAHDAWAHLRQVSLTLGSFTGQMRYGIRGLDMNGRWVTKEKVYEQNQHVLGDDLPFDAEDHLQVARELKEWFFFASSTETAGVTDPSFGQLSLVQYRYTPVSVNVGYDYGQVETFEYSRAVAGAESMTDNGTPQPYLDTRRP